MITLRKASERGHADHGWLNSWHTFSFADYYDPAHMGFRTLRVINDDIIAPGGGFGTHPHRDMEIFSYILEGALEHKDSMGNGRVLRPGQVQLMSAGRGVTHSEFNPSATEAARLLQIWIHPRERGLKPSYTEWNPDPAKERAPKVLLISPDGRDSSAVIHQDAEVYRIRLQPGETLTHDIAGGHGLWFQLIKGKATANGVALNAADAVAVESEASLTLSASDEVEGLLFDFGAA